MKHVEQIVFNNGFWENADKVLKICGPIVNVLRMVDGNKPCMGFVYESIDHCKEAIASALMMWKLITRRYGK